MISIESLRWTSRDEVGAELLPLLDDESSPWHLPAARLVAFLAPRSLVPAYVRIALDRGRGFWIRICALRALARSGEAIAEDALAALLAEDPPAPAPAALFPSAPTTPSLVELLPLARGPSRLSLVLAHLAQKPPAFVRALLLESVTLADKPSPEVERWLVDRWLEDLAGRAPDDEDAEVARAALDAYPEVKGVLVAHWSRAARDDRFFWDLYFHPDLVDLLVTDEAARAEAARALVSSPWALREVLGAEAIRRAVIEAVRAKSAALVRSEEPPAPYRYRGALDWLEFNDPDLAAELLADETLAPVVRAELGVALLHKRRHLALRALVRGGEPGHRPLVRALLRAVAVNPCGQDLAELRGCLDLPDPAAQYRALDLLDALAEDGPAVREALSRLASHDDPRLRVRALGALARRGHGESLRALVEAARSASEVCVRAEALRRLGALDAARDHFKVFEQALRSDHASDGAGLHTPAAEQAAIALGAVFGGEALTALMRGYLVAPGELAEMAIESAMAVVMEELTGTARSAAERREEIVARDGGVTVGWTPFDGREVGVEG
ncbi:HEAT repeat domain-containing protein [Polyangium aurulentum]|uniref:HEAT repeat domain-containing protein n=1 Tax=Polyangium aurulentum TaxID=2567896 RepID=UPI0010ADF742|nr:HEAT repeat domain-containing protein [Polyangium aurulentum]UQA56201.1 HEAT repeat domain-containing protein [Polyangium aurulentum]